MTQNRITRGSRHLEGRVARTRLRDEWLSTLLRRRRRGDGGTVVEAEAAEARQLHRRMAHIEPGDQPEEVELDAFDPANLHAEQTPQGGFYAGAAVGAADVGEGAKILANRVRRQ